MSWHLTRFAPVLVLPLILATAPDRVESRQAPALSRQERRLADGITAAALKGHVSCLAADSLEGRGTPSKGLDAAADYIASRFRACGLEPAGDTGYFQTAAFETVTQPTEGLSLSVEAGGRSTPVSKGDLVHLATGRLDRSRTGLFLLDLDNLPAAANDETRDRVLVADLANVQAWTPEQRAARSRIMEDPQAAVARLGGAALLVNRSRRDNFGGVQLREASGEAACASPPIISVNSEDFRHLVAGWKPGLVPATVDLAVPAPVVAPVVLKNVAGALRGSDPGLRDTYVIVSAHYDHLGIRASGEGDRVFHGANDDASGVAAMLDIANAITGARLRPKRTILFVAFFGEEKSGLGAKWYVKHPLFPLARTVANLNLEQLGRTDDADGLHTASASITGFDYSEVGDLLAGVGPALGVHFDDRLGDKYFDKADNVFLARAGVPAHTIAVTGDFPGRHTPGDEAGKLDYANLELVTRAVGLGVWSLATDAHAPRWNSTNPGARPYLEAWEKLLPAQ